MEQNITKGMILSAGLGTRLRPLTLTTPKPVLPLGKTTPIELALGGLIKAGITDIVVNLHHLPDVIKEHLGDGSRFGVKFTYSLEPTILGTGGGIKNVEELFGNEPFVVVNGDIICDVNIKDVIKTHLAKGAYATLVVRKHELPFTALDVDKTGFVSGIGVGNFMYTGVQVLTKNFLNVLPPRGKPSCIVNDGYKRCLTDGMHIAAHKWNGHWADIGTIASYETAKKKFS